MRCDVLAIGTELLLGHLSKECNRTTIVEEVMREVRVAKGDLRVTVVDPLEDVGDPADLALAVGDLQVGELGDEQLFRRIAHGFPGQGVQQVRLAEAVGAVEQHRVEVAVGPGGGLGQGLRIGRHPGQAMGHVLFGVEGGAIQPAIPRDPGRDGVARPTRKGVGLGRGRV